MDNLHWKGTIEIPPIKKLCQILETKFLEQESEIERLKNEIKNVKSEHYKDSELKKLKEENSVLKLKLIRGFPISEKESNKINEFMSNHDCPYKNRKIGGASNYRFDIIPGIGYNAYVTCTCGKEFCFYKE